MLPKIPLKLWTQLSRKKKVKYIESVKQLYGEPYDKEGKDISDTNRKAGTNKTIHVADEK